MKPPKRVWGALSPTSLWANLRHTYDYDAPNLPPRVRLERLHQALFIARRRCPDHGLEPELDFALAECNELLALTDLDDETVERERVHQRLERIRRITQHHEGRLAALNRRYWWIACSALLIWMAVNVLPDVLTLFG